MLAIQMYIDEAYVLFVSRGTPTFPHTHCHCFLSVICTVYFNKPLKWVISRSRGTDRMCVCVCVCGVCVCVGGGGGVTKSTM